MEKVHSTLLKYSLAASLLTTTLILAGCGGGGGGSGNAGSPNPDPVTITSLRVGTPICSTSGNGVLNGPTTAGTAATVSVTPGCTDADATMLVMLGVNSSETNISHYDWEIVGWRNSAPHGDLDKYSQIIDVDPVNGRYIVRSDAPEIRYVSAPSSELATLSAPFSQTVTVTVWTEDGRWGSGTFTVILQPGGTAVATISGALTSGDSTSHSRAAHYADFYRLTGAGNTTLRVEGLDTYLYVYNSARQLIGEADDGANNGGSQLSLSLQSGQTYYVEVTSFAPNETGPYQLTSTSGALGATASPWAGISVPNIAGNFSVSEDTTITIIYDGVTTTTNATANTVANITQTGSSFSFQTSDPSGTLPAMTRYGSLDGFTVTFTGDPFLPVNPDINVTSRTGSSSGTIGNNTFTVTTSAQLQGNYNGKPLTAQLDSTAVFTR